MSRDPRAEELHNLKLALATFTLQLDAFEARLKGILKALSSAPPDNRLASKIVAAMKSVDPNSQKSDLARRPNPTSTLYLRSAPIDSTGAGAWNHSELVEIKPPLGISR
jgi:hypothetical protein